MLVVNRDTAPRDGCPPGLDQAVTKCKPLIYMRWAAHTSER